MKKTVMILLMLLISANFAFASDVDIKQLTEAALSGDAESQYLLGDCYTYGDGVSQSFTEALKWYVLAAKQNHAEAQASLGICYEEGDGVPKNNKLAYMWYTISIPYLSDPEYKEEIKIAFYQLEAKMTKEEISEAQQMASNWSIKMK